MGMAQRQTQANENVLPSEGTALIKNRFGEIEVDYSNAIYFPKGIYGFPPELHFALVSFPNPALESFKVLQCLNDHSIAFPVFPVGYNNQFIHEKDMHECAETVEVKPENMAMLLIASSENSGTADFKVSVNVQAPLIVDVELKMAVQYIFTSSKYSTKEYVVS